MKTKLNLYTALLIVHVTVAAAMNQHDGIVRFIGTEAGPEMALYNRIANHDDVVNYFTYATVSNSKLEGAMHAQVQQAIANFDLSSSKELFNKKPYIAVCDNMHAPLPLFGITMFNVKTKQWVTGKKIRAYGSTATIEDSHHGAPATTEIMCAILNIASYEDITAKACALAIQELKRHEIKIVLNVNKKIEHNLDELLQEPALETYIDDAAFLEEYAESVAQKITNKDSKQTINKFPAGRYLLFGGCIALIAFLCHRFLR